MAGAVHSADAVLQPLISRHGFTAARKGLIKPDLDCFSRGFSGTGRVLAPVSTLLVSEIEDSSKVTRAVRGSSAEMALSKIGIPCPPRKTVTVGGKPAPSLAETLRGRMAAELGKVATPLF